MMEKLFHLNLLTLKPKIHLGYYKIVIRLGKPSKQINVSVHRLAALQRFGLGALLNKSLDVRHLDNNKLNNSLDNLAMGTKSQNYYDNPKEQRESALNKARNNSVKVTRKFNDDEVALIRLQRQSGMTYSQLAYLWKCSKATLSYILSNSAKKSSKY